jgi:competence protein ComEC
MAGGSFARALARSYRRYVRVAAGRGRGSEGDAPRDRSFIDRSESLDFQKTGAFHVLVVAGLHVGALVFFLHWLARKLKFSREMEALLILALLLSYLEMVEQRAPVLRASLMTAIVLLGSVFYRRLDLLNSAALAALILLMANPDYLSDSGFLLSFLAMGCIAGIAVPVLDQHIDPFARALTEWPDLTRDAGHAPLMFQFRMDFRDAVLALTARLRGRLARWAQGSIAGARLAARDGNVGAFLCVAARHVGTDGALF